MVTVARALRDRDGILLGSSSALNVAGALYAASKMGPGKTIVTFNCDLADRSSSKLYNAEFLARKDIIEDKESLEELFARYQNQPDDAVVNVAS